MRASLFMLVSVIFTKLCNGYALHIFFSLLEYGNDSVLFVYSVRKLCSVSVAKPGSLYEKRKCPFQETRSSSKIDNHEAKPIIG